MVHPQVPLVAGLASAAIAGIALGVYIGGGSSTASSTGRGVFAGLGCWLCGKRRRPKYPKRLILVRHGQSEGNIDPTLYCSVPDNAMHLTTLGFEQAVAAGESIKKIIGEETVRFIVSPYIRTIETFQGITKAWGNKGKHIPWSEEPRIREQDFGNFQEPLKIRECKLQRKRFGSFFYRFPSGESPADVYDRISSFLESLYRMFDKMSEQNYVLVTHGVAIRVILMRYFKYRISEFEQLDNFHNGEFVVLDFDDVQWRYNLTKVVSNKVALHEDGSIRSVDTSESHALRVYSMDALSPMLAPYPTSPVNHFRRMSVSASSLPPLPPQSHYTGMDPSSSSSSEELELSSRVPIALHTTDVESHEGGF